MMKSLAYGLFGAFIASAVLLFAGLTYAAPCPTYPYVLTNGQTADANQVMANFNSILNCTNTNLATAGTNSNITAITGLTTPLSIGQGGTGATTLSGVVIALGGPFLTVANNLSDVASAATARTNLGAAPLASPTFTGTPAAPTAAVNTNTTQLATTAFVVAQQAVAQQYAQFQNQQTSGTASGETLTAATWIQRVLNTTITNTISGASLTSNQITLPAGAYKIDAQAAMAPNSGGTNAQAAIRLRNITASSTILVSPSEPTVASVPTVETLSGVFVLSGSTVVEIDHYNHSSLDGTGGKALSSGEAEVYVNVVLQKIG